MGLIIPPWLRIAGAVAVALSIFLTGFWYGQRGVQTEWLLASLERTASDAKQAAELEAKNRKIEAERLANITRISTDAQTQIDEARRDAVAADNAADRLRQRAALLASRCASRNTTTANPGSTTDAPGDLLADMLQKSVQRNRELAEYADSARIAGLACERAYDTARENN